MLSSRETPGKEKKGRKEWETARAHLRASNENAALRKIATEDTILQTLDSGHQTADTGRRGNRIASGKWKLKSNGLLEPHEEYCERYENGSLKIHA